MKILNNEALRTQYINDNHLSDHLPEDILTKVELIENLDAACTVVSIGETRLLRIQSEILRRYGKNNPQFLKYIIHSITEKFKMAHNNHSNNLIHPVKNRLASYLLWHKSTYNEIKLEESLQEISEFIGTTYRQLHRGMKSLEKENIIIKDGKKFIY